MQILSNFIDANMNISERDKKMLIFSITCIFYDVSKLLLFIVLFALLHRLDLFLFAFIILLPLRLSSGGLHFKHYMSCLFFSLGYFLLVTIPLTGISIPFWSAIISLGLCTIINGALSPILSASRPPLPEREIIHRKKKTLLATSFGILLLILFYQTKYFAVGYWTILLHSVQLIIAKLRKKRGE
ncbi:MAG: accessory gene regulator B family protein [Lachnospiraceae bacterium]|nr:accessory gene regulator B family protein [Lachnospiraceae bacterium]